MSCTEYRQCERMHPIPGWQRRAYRCWNLFKVRNRTQRYCTPACRSAAYSQAARAEKKGVQPFLVPLNAFEAADITYEEDDS